jgi:hypothetical protein
MMICDTTLCSREAKLTDISFPMICLPCKSSKPSYESEMKYELILLQTHRNWKLQMLKGGQVQPDAKRSLQRRQQDAAVAQVPVVPMETVW